MQHRKDYFLFLLLVTFKRYIYFILDRITINVKLQEFTFLLLLQINAEKQKQAMGEDSIEGNLV